LAGCAKRKPSCRNEGPCEEQEWKKGSADHEALPSVLPWRPAARSYASQFSQRGAEAAVTAITETGALRYRSTGLSARR
jgi:hypothetical protein